MIEYGSDKETRLLNVLNERRSLLENVGTGEVQASNGIESAIKIGRIRGKVEASIGRIEEELEAEELRNRFPALRNLFNEGKITEKEFAPYRNRVEALGLKDDDIILQEFKQLGIKGKGLAVISVLSSLNISSALTLDDIAKKLGWTREFTRHDHDGVERTHTYNQGSKVSDTIPPLRKKVAKLGYRIATRDTHYDSPRPRGVGRRGAPSYFMMADPSLIGEGSE
ncbi:hypothetical protein ACFL2C_02495 [Patescibacteria group bacterium]